MSMRVIALTSANETAMQAVATQLLQAASDGKLLLHVVIGVKDAHEAQAVYCGGGELWRIGEDDSTPELDALIDRAIDDSSPGRMAVETSIALRRCFEKVNVAPGAGVAA